MRVAWPRRGWGGACGVRPGCPAGGFPRGGAGAGRPGRLPVGHGALARRICACLLPFRRGKKLFSSPPVPLSGFKASGPGYVVNPPRVSFFMFVRAPVLAPWPWRWVGRHRGVITARGGGPKNNRRPPGSPPCANFMGPVSLSRGGGRRRRLWGLLGGRGNPFRLTGAAAQVFFFFLPLRAPSGGLGRFFFYLPPPSTNTS